MQAKHAVVLTIDEMGEGRWRGTRYSSPPQLRYPPFTLLLQLRHFELGSKKIHCKLF